MKKSLSTHFKIKNILFHEENSKSACIKAKIYFFIDGLGALITGVILFLVLISVVHSSTIISYSKCLIITPTIDYNSLLMFS